MPTAWTALRRMIIAGVLVLLAACAASTPGFDTSRPVARLSADLADQVPDRTPRDQAVRKGIAALVSAAYAEASRQFNIALKFDPENSQLHFLNGLAYQLLMAAGDQQKAPLAETAYLLALQLDPRNHLAAHQLGRLYLDQRAYERAESYLADAVTWRRDNADAYQTLAVAAYYNRNLAMALWASANAERLDPEQPVVLRTAAVLATIAGEDERASASMKRYTATGIIAPRLVAFEQRLAQLKAERNDPPPQLAQAPGNQGAPGAPGIPGTSGAPEMPAAPGMPGGAAASAEHATGQSPRPWFDCGAPIGVPGSPFGGVPGMVGASGFGGVGSGSSPSDEPVPIPALPSPCTGAAVPRMALIDIVYIRTEESETTSKGVNLLQGLQVVLNGNLSRLRTAGSGTTTPTVTNTNSFALALGNTAAAGITYSLNIANAAEEVDEVIARPTLVALDRQPSQFFSGANLSYALTGQYGGNVVEKPIGVSLSVTPTFVDDDTLLLSVKAARSFIETTPTGAGGPGAVETTRNMAVANVALKFDQTLVLSGLSEKQINRSSNSVPFLGDVPLVEYLFANRSTSLFSKSVLILLTPRRPAYGDQLPTPVDRVAARPSLEELRKRAASAIKPNSNLEVIAHSLHVNQHYLAYRAGDVTAEYWSEPRSLSRVLNEALGLLYF